MTVRLKQNSILLILLVIIFIATLFLQDRIAIRHYAREAPESLLYLPPAEIAPTMAMGYEMLWADLNWIRLLQYFGGLYLTTRDYPQIERLFEVIFALDPYFEDAYLFSSLAVGEEAEKPEKALEFLEKGMEHMPDNWRLPFDAGFLAMQTMGDYDLAKEYFKIATEKPHCPAFVYRIIPHLETEAGRFETALFYYQQGLEEAIERNDEVSQAIYERNIKETINKMHLTELNEAIEKYKEEQEETPDTIEQLVEEGYITEIPEEPHGGEYYIDPYENISSTTDAKQYLQQYLQALRREIQQYYRQHEEYPATLDDLGPELAKEPFFGEWEYDPETGEVHSSSHPDL